MAPKIVVAAMTRTENMGDRAIFHSLSEQLLELGCSVEGLNLGGDRIKAKEKRKAGLLVVERIKKIKPLWSFLKKVYWINNKRKYKRFIRNNLVGADAVIIGGGQLITDVGFGLPPRLDAIRAVCNDLGLPYSIFSCGVGDNFSDEARLIYKKLLDESVYSSTRGFVSRERLQKLNPGKKIECVLDPVFISDKKKSVDCSGRRVGICLQSYAQLRTHLDECRELSDSDFDRVICTIIDQFISADFSVLLFTTGVSEDKLVCERIFSQFYSDCCDVHVEKNVSSISDLYGVISSMNAVVSFRMHAAIIAYSMGVKTLNLKWDDKINDVWSGVGAASVVLDITDVFVPGFSVVSQVESLIVSKNDVVGKKSFYKRALGECLESMGVMVGNDVRK